MAGIEIGEEVFDEVVMRVYNIKSLFGCLLKHKHKFVIARNHLFPQQSCKVVHVHHLFVAHVLLYLAGFYVLQDQTHIPLDQLDILHYFLCQLTHYLTVAQGSITPTAGN